MTIYKRFRRIVIDTVRCKMLVANFVFKAKGTAFFSEADFVFVVRKLRDVTAYIVGKVGSQLYLSNTLNIMLFWAPLILSS